MKRFTRTALVGTVALAMALVFVAAPASSMAHAVDHLEVELAGDSEGGAAPSGEECELCDAIAGGRHVVHALAPAIDRAPVLSDRLRPSEAAPLREAIERACASPRAPPTR